MFQVLFTRLTKNNVPLFFGNIRIPILFGNNPIILGRWHLNDKPFVKVDYSNTDHCGVCDKEREK